MAILASSTSLSPSDCTEKSTEVKIPPLPNISPPRQRSLHVFIVVLVVVLVTVRFPDKSQGQRRDQRGLKHRCSGKVDIDRFFPYFVVLGSVGMGVGGGGFIVVIVVVDVLEVVVYVVTAICLGIGQRHSPPIL